MWLHMRIRVKSTCQHKSTSPCKVSMHIVDLETNTKQIRSSWVWRISLQGLFHVHQTHHVTLWHCYGWCIYIYIYIPYTYKYTLVSIFQVHILIEFWSIFQASHSVPGKPSSTNSKAVNRAPCSGWKGVTISTSHNLDKSSHAHSCPFMPVQCSFNAVFDITLPYLLFIFWKTLHHWMTSLSPDCRALSRGRMHVPAYLLVWFFGAAPEQVMQQRPKNMRPCIKYMYKYVYIYNIYIYLM